MKEVLWQIKIEKSNHIFPFYNDLNPDFPLSPGFATSSGDGVCEFLSVERIKEYVAEKDPGYFTTEKGKAFKAMADRLKYDDNEVVAVMKWN